jgi:hypothetical protein
MNTVSHLFRQFIVIALCGIYAVSNAYGVPRRLKEDSTATHVLKVDRSVTTIPHGIKAALKSLFKESTLSMADPHKKFRQTDVTTTDAERRLPIRRLITAFGTKHFYYVYYEAGGFEGACKLVVFNRGTDSKFVWGGVELRDPAPSLDELLRRVRKDEFDDTKRFYW